MVEARGRSRMCRSNEHAMLGAGSLGGGGLRNSYASEATRVAAALAGKMPKEVRPAGERGWGRGEGGGREEGGRGGRRPGRKIKRKAGVRFEEGSPGGKGKRGS